MGVIRDRSADFVSAVANMAMAPVALHANHHLGAPFVSSISSQSLRIAFQAPEISRRMKRLDQNKSRLKLGDISDQEKTLLRGECSEIAKFVLENAPLVAVTPDSDPRLLQQLFENEQVHKMASSYEVLDRIGDDKSDKQCYALVVPTVQGPRVLAGVFIHFTNLPEAQGRIDYTSLPANVQALREKPRHIIQDGPGQAAVFWTISYSAKIGLPGAGQELIRRVYGHLPSDMLKTTLSPVRGFTGVSTDHPKDMVAELAKGADVLRGEVLAYLLEQQDPVLNFHCGNGAYVANININPADPIDWITINYLYPSDPAVLAENRVTFKSGQVPMSAPLYKSLPPADRVGADVVITDLQVPLWTPPVVTGP